jgi:hypothetical protein
VADQNKIGHQRALIFLSNGHAHPVKRIAEVNLA